MSDDDITADTYAKDNVFQTFLKYFRDNTPIEDIINEVSYLIYYLFLDS